MNNIIYVCRRVLNFQAVFNVSVHTFVKVAFALSENDFYKKLLDKNIVIY